MLAPEIPADDAQRVAALHGLGVLDTEPEERFDRITRVARRVLGVDIAIVSLVDENRQWFKSTDGLDTSETAREISFCGHAILDDDVFVVPDAGADPRFSDNPLVTSDPNIRFYAGCPLTVGTGHRVGTLCIIGREPRELSADDEALLRDLAAMAQKELEDFDLATTDELTGLTNRRGLLMFGRQILAAAERRRRPVGIMYLDLDGLKVVNDTEGHAAGDALIRAFADTLLNCLRSCDVIARMWGDEFCVLASETDRAGLLKLEARIRDTLADPGRPGPRLSASIGLADSSPTNPETMESLLAQADAAMYEAKRARRTPAG